ncbi:PilT/PilU family type 4a pilus ATPase [Kingella negevensis]|uniref:Twitching mobility protein n=1 Tax=Kingella negevensis TaxID=1522312 RepID=A0A238T9N9_9NEIS|nr:PilT/PilU family type 4a pilus ATPase [Kingella negevensis]MDK4684594.1 PilT/PilU family type 4a pilus ATPase [Kingella negevensis]MDK4696261.1 PilT/PilU family type 4a pilus ATPase [Kingella negevensis]MDK4707724.1 PilT/PilU family type 4a pilus ATPase [Kingella negevensis]MDK4709840.1 PilT/PilU family type 4a pilus ATPase [Kingella negevensis]SNB60894.1 Twitching mobility protein [Kingella negevensis]
MSEQNSNPSSELAQLLEGFVNTYQVTPENGPKPVPHAAGKAIVHAQQHPNDPQAAKAAAAASTAEVAQRKGLHPLLERMSLECEKRQASDIFISAGFPPSFKINGELTPVPLKPLTPQDTQILVYSTMNADQRARFDQELELNYSVSSSDGTRYRVNAYHEQGRMGMVWRRITTKILTVDDLHLPQGLKDLAMQPRGLLILAGATGSGKSTSMAAMLDWRNKHAAGHIVTIEDPVEYLHKPIKSIFTQRELGIDTNSWSMAVQSAMRQAPDVVCVGEVRNEHTMEYALQLAQTGHLCIFTIHANNAVQTIERIMNFYPEERHQQVLMDLALNTVGIIGQRLARLKEGGRRAVVDLLVNTPAMQDFIFKGELMECSNLMARSQNDGMQTFDQDLLNLYKEGLITKEEALRQAESVNDLNLAINLWEDGKEQDGIFNRVRDLQVL